MHKVYYFCRLKPLAPLCLSGGENENTDRDVLLDAAGRPFLPASSIAGVLREMAGENATFLFGARLAESQEITTSRVVITDGVLEQEAVVKIGKRDGIGLDDRKNALDTAKYDFEIVEMDKDFLFTMETEDDAAAKLGELVAVAVKKGILLGGKTTRGFGRMQVTAWRKDFDLTDAVERRAWLDFDPEDLPKNAEPVSAAPVNASTLEVELVQCGSLIVRRYSTEVSTGAETKPDYTPITNAAGRPVVPGTSWAGAFRHHMRVLAQQTEIDFDDQALFGCAGDADTPATRSNIVFSESIVEGGRGEKLTRTAIERFSGGAANSKLFTSVVWRDGKCRLAIRFAKEAAVPPEAWRLLAATLMDLNEGFVSLGGESGIGRGCFKITKISLRGCDITQQLRDHDLTMLEGGAQ